MNIYGKFEGFPLKSTLFGLVWAGNIMTRVHPVGSSQQVRYRWNMFGGG